MHHTPANCSLRIFVCAARRPGPGYDCSGNRLRPCLLLPPAGQVLDVHFPPVVYKKLLGQAPGFADLKAAFPELGRGLQQLLDFEGDVEHVFCRT